MKLNCRICYSNALTIEWNLGKSPHGDKFENSVDQSKLVKRENLILAKCNGCGLLQLTDNPDEVSLYRDYRYQTKVTNNLDKFYKNLVDREIIPLISGKNDFVVDIGSADGSFLRIFQEKGMKTLGVEPSIFLAELAVELGTETVAEFMSGEIAESISQNYESPSLISLNYVLANVSDPYGFMLHIKRMMGNDTLLSIITGYHIDQFAVNMFDYISHDHVTYFSLANLQSIASMLGLVIVDVQRYEHKGGSLHLLLRNNPGNDSSLSSPSLFQILQREAWMSAIEYFKVSSLMQRIETERNKLLDYLEQNQISTLCGVGASTSTTHLINYFKLESVLSQLLDDDLSKIGKFSPGHSIIVNSLDSAAHLNSKPMIILAWQHSAKIIERLTEIGFHGEVILPLPSFKIVTL